MKSLRARDKLTQEDLSERSGLHTTEISRIESGRRSPKLETLEKLATGLKVPLWYLMALNGGLTMDQANQMRQVADSF